MVTNNANVGLAGITVTDILPQELTNVTWSVVFTGTGSNGNASGSGNRINKTIKLALGGTATYTITTTLASTAPFGVGNLVNTVTITSLTGVTGTSYNNSATDTKNVLHARNLVVFLQASCRGFRCSSVSTGAW